MHSKTEGVCTTWEYDRIWVNLIESSVRVGNYYIFNKLRRRSGEIEASDFRKKGWKKLTGSALRDRTSLFLFRSWPSTSWIKRKDWNGLNLFKFRHCTLHFGSFGHDRTLMLRCSFVQQCFFFARMAEMLQGTVLLCNQQISCTNNEGTTTQLR